MWTYEKVEETNRESTKICEISQDRCGRGQGVQEHINHIKKQFTKSQIAGEYSSDVIFYSFLPSTV